MRSGHFGCLAVTMHLSCLWHGHPAGDAGCWQQVSAVSVAEDVLLANVGARPRSGSHRKVCLSQPCSRMLPHGVIEQGEFQTHRVAGVRVEYFPRQLPASVLVGAIWEIIPLAPVLPIFSSA